MAQTLKVTVCGGDKRYLKAYQLFSRRGYEALYTNCEKLRGINDADIIVLPIPSFDRDGNLTGSDYTIYDFLGMVKSGTVIFAGKVPSIIKRIAAEYKVQLYDYTDNEEFNILNAVSTAEGAILTALEKTFNTISHSNYTVLGYGRIGRALSMRLKALGGNVTVGARSAAARATAISDAVKADTIENALKNENNAHVIFNTVPAPIITEENISQIQNCLIIDLASIPGGLTERAKYTVGENFIHALSLPGKCFPDTAGETIFKTIDSILHEKGVIE